MKFNLLEMQYFQELHDRQYHIDIYHMQTFKRIAHLHQHLVKYSGANVINRSQDALACILSMANTLNINISKSLATRNIFVADIEDIGPRYYNDILHEQYQNNLKSMTKLLEGHDHVETLNYRNDMATYICDLLIVLLQLYRSTDETSNTVLATEWLIRIFEIKQKSIFFAYHHSNDMQSNLYKSFTLLRENMCKAT